MRKFDVVMLRILLPLSLILAVVGVGVKSSVPHFIPDIAITQILARFGDGGLVVIASYLLIRIIQRLISLYGSSKNHTVDGPRWRIILDIATSYILAIYAFAVLYTQISRNDPIAFNSKLDLGSSLYFSIVTISSTGFGELFPQSGWARTAVAGEILFGLFYTVLFFGALAGLAGQRSQRP